MQAQSYPPERSSSHSTSIRQSVDQEPSLPQGKQQRRHRGERTAAITADVQAAARTGNFQAIATILNTSLNPHQISAWVGEAGPGYLQVTLTVKRPPQRNPLVRWVSHQLYSLRSDVILGANLTVQVAQTNLILWNQMVRLPLPDIYKQPTKLERCQDQLKEWQQKAGGKASIVWTNGQQHIKEWLKSDRLSSLWSPHSDLPQPPSGAASLAASPLPQIDSTNHGVEAEHKVSVPPEILQQAQQYAQSVENQEQWAATTMVPGVVMAPSPPATSVSTVLDPTVSTKAETTTPFKLPSLGGGDGSGSGFGGGLGRGLGRFRTTMVEQVLHPSPWMLGGAAIAAFFVGSTLIDSVYRGMDGSSSVNAPKAGDSRTSSSSNSSTDSEPSSTAIATTETASSDRSGPNADNSSDSGNGNGRESGSADSTEGPTVLPPSTHREKTVEMGDQTIDVVPLVPTVANHSEVTLTFSGKAIVPLPPPEPEEAQGWRSIFSRSSPPVSHPADIAMALFNTPVSRQAHQQTSQQTSQQTNQQTNGHTKGTNAALADYLSIQTLRQGGVDVVNIAGNGIAKTQDPSIKETMQILKRSAIRFVGAGGNDKTARRPQIFDIKGHRIAVLGYVDTHLFAANSDMAGNNPGSRQRLAEDINAIREQVDWVIVSYHWSNIETAPSTAAPTEQQTRLAHLAVDEGADLVVGYHPDLMQGGEIYKGRAIAYSIGQVPVSPDGKVPEPATIEYFPQDPGSLSEAEADSQMAADVDTETDSSNTLDTVPHQLPEFGIRTSPSNADVNQHSATRQSSADHAIATMLKVVLGDRSIGVELIPVQTRSGQSEYAETKKDRQLVLQTLKDASQSFEHPFSLGEMTHLNMEETIREFSNSAGETFQPDRTDGFIDETE